MKRNQNTTKEPSLVALRRVLPCLLTLRLQKMHICVFTDYFSFSQFFGRFLLLLEIKTKIIKFCTKFQVKQGKFLLFKCTSLLLHRKPAKLPAVFQNLQKTVSALRIKNEIEAQKFCCELFKIFQI